MSGKLADWDPSAVQFLTSCIGFSTGAGYFYGLRVVLNASTNDQYCSLASNTGFMIQIHSPDEQPLPLYNSHLVQHGYETRIVVSPFLVKVSPKVKSIPKRVRRCFFQDESPLTYFGWADDVMFSPNLHTSSDLIERFFHQILHSFSAPTPEPTVWSSSVRKKFIHIVIVHFLWCHLSMMRRLSVAKCTNNVLTATWLFDKKIDRIWRMHVWTRAGSYRIDQV